MNGELTPLTRREEFLSAAAGEGECPDPLTRIEMFLAAAAGEGECPTPVTRLEEFLAAAAGQGEAPDPVTRVEQFLAAISGKGEAPEPVTRLEMFLAGWAEGGGGEIKTLTGNAPLTFDALAAALVSLTQDGKTVQDGTPTPDAPVDIVCNNGTLKMRHRSGLPTGYKLLDSVGSNGDAYVITNTYLASTDVVETEFRNSSTTGYGALYGIYKTGESTALYGNRTYYGYDETNIAINTDIPVDTEWHSSRHDFVNGTLTIDDTTISFTPWTFANTTKNGILTRYYNGSYGYVWKGYIRKFKVTRGNEVICDLLPAKNSNDVAGLYDLISGDFYTATGGTLLEGDVVDDYELIVDGTPEVLSLAGNYASGELTGYGTYVSPTTTAGNRAYKRLDVPNGTYQFAVDGDYEIIVQWRDPADPSITVQNYENLSGWITSGEVTLNKPSGGYGITVRRTSGTSITPDTFDGTLYCTATPQTASVSNLYAVGDYKDTQEIIGGVVTHRVGIKVLDGTESGWALSDSGTTHRFRSVKPSDCHTPASRAASVCTHFKYVSTGSAVGGMFIGASQYWYFIPTDQTIDTVDEWTAWLKAQYDNGTPVIVLYPLATETTESVTAQSLRTEKGGNTISVTSEVDPVNLTVEYKGAKE